MKSYEEVQHALDQEVPSEAVHPGDSSKGIFGKYVTGQWAIQEANEIFGFDGWSATKVGDDRFTNEYGDYVFTMDVDVQIYYLIEDNSIRSTSRLGRGVGVARCSNNRRTGEVNPPTAQQLDTAAKSAKTDAIKNALSQFGRHLGGELYFDERMAQVLGWEEEGDKATQRSNNSEEELGMYVCDGWGSEGKFKGMTLAEIFDDADGISAMKWAVDKNAKGAMNEKFIAYYKMREQQAMDAVEEFEDSERKKDKREMVKMWFGDMKPKDEVTSGKGEWRVLVNTEAFVEMLRDKLDPEHKIDPFSPNNPRVMNHLKRHFGIVDGRKITWGMLQALYIYCKEGSSAAEFAYPEYYGGERAPTDKSLEQEQSVDAAEVNSVHETPPINVGAVAAGTGKSVPTGLLKYAKDAGVEKPDDFLSALLQGVAYDEWRVEYTDLMMKTIDVFKQGVPEEALKKAFEYGFSRLSK